MADKVFCQICKKELTGKIYWVNCQYFNYHPFDECGGCEYPVGATCIKKVEKYDKTLIIHNETVDEWNKRVDEWNKNHNPIKNN